VSLVQVRDAGSQRAFMVQASSSTQSASLPQAAPASQPLSGLQLEPVGHRAGTATWRQVRMVSSQLSCVQSTWSSQSASLAHVPMPESLPPSTLPSGEGEASGRGGALEPPQLAKTKSALANSAGSNPRALGVRVRE
jgi:hypothetical protein